MDKLLNTIKKLIPRKLFKALQPGYHFIMNALAALLFRFPSNELIVIGVTGTTGKTTSVYLIAKMLEHVGLKTGFTSTAMFNDGKKEWLNDKKMTMIGRLFTQKILRSMVKNGCRVAIVETTSEGIVQYRHKFINYDILIFTGLYEEHIESHGSFEKYKEAKGRLFAHLKSCSPKYINNENLVVKPRTEIKKIDLEKIKKLIIVNGNDEHADYFLSFWAEEKLAYYSLDEKAVTLKENNLEFLEYGEVASSASGTGFIVGGDGINLKLLGGFNASNAMNVVCAGLVLGKKLPEIKAGLESINGVPGRLERIDEGQDFTVIVDYAFEPKAVAKLYDAIEYIEHNRIIHLLGSTGGGRDIARRPKLGELAGKRADYVIITNEDPYDDDPDVIIGQVALGAEKAGKKEGIDLFKILDRREAIKEALNVAQSGDIVMITGKGSEQAICVANGEKVEWDDRAVVRGLLRGGI